MKECATYTQDVKSFQLTIKTIHIPLRGQGGAGNRFCIRSQVCQLL